jgi:hypothetical protein
MSILWSDDCLSCLCNFPHTLEAHLRAVERARAALQFEMQEREHDLAGEWEQDEEIRAETNVEEYETSRLNAVSPSYAR